MATPLPQNRARFTIDEIVAATSGVVVRAGSPAVGVSTDSRNVVEGALFVALAGDKFDGHHFLAGVAAAGASVLLVHRDVDADALAEAARAAGRTAPGIVRVADTRKALGDLAHAHRVRWAAAPHQSGPRRVLAITGSAGKTTTKTATARLLDAVAPGEVHAAAGNLNNDIGVPHTLFGLLPEHRLAVIEVGTSARGEIRNLARIVAPDAAVLTLVAAAHVQGLGSLDDVAVEKGDLLAAVGPGGFALANADDARAAAQLARAGGAHAITYGFADGATYRIAARASLGTAGARIVVDRPAGRIEFAVPLVGASGALAAAAAVAAAEGLLGRALSQDEVEAGFAALETGVEGRLRPLRLADGTVVLDDTYNANPASMRSSIAAASELARHEGRRLLLVLGEMRELGPVSVTEHGALGQVAGASDAAYVLGVSGDAATLVDEARRLGKEAEFAPDASAAAPIVAAKLQPGDVLLVKGSRGVATEKVVAAVVARVGTAPSEGSGGREAR